MWLRTNAGTVLTALVGSEPMPSLGSVWPEATIREREIHEMFGVSFDSDDSHIPLLFGAGHPLSGTFPLLKRNLLRSRNEVAWPGTKDPADAGGSPSRRKALPVGVVPDMQSFEGDFL
jgi:NADH:ubiquinone oxidoreductase subunit C